MTMSPVSLQDLRRRIYVTAKADKTKRFWGLYVHVVKRETLRTAYALAKRNNGAPGIDGVTFAGIEAAGVEAFLAQLRDELVTRTYRPLRNRRVEIPKRGGKVRVLGIPALRDRVVQGALKLILEPIFEADFCNGSYGYRPRRTAHEAVARVEKDIVEGKTRVIDLDLAAYFDTVRHDLLLGKVAGRVQDGEILHLLKLMLKASGKRGVPQGGVLSPLLANIYLTEVDAMLERATTVTREGVYTRVDYARYADDLVILVDWHPRHDWLLRAVHRRLREELAQRTAWLGKLRDVFRRHQSQPVGRVIAEINPILRGWANYFRIGNARRCLAYVRLWVEQRVRRHLMRARGRQGFGWKRWSTAWLHERLGLFGDYRVRYWAAPESAPSP